MGTSGSNPLSQLNLPPGFRFYPTDEELMVEYLCRKVVGHNFPLEIIGDVDLYKHDPWELPSKALFGEKEWYFFSPRDRKYPNGSRPNRVAGSGYWKATGTDKAIAPEGRKVGIKKALVFYVGRAPSGTKTNWIMHEYRLTEPSRKIGSSKLDEWVLCRIYKKKSSADSNDDVSGVSGVSRDRSKESSPTSSCSHYDDVFESLPEIDRFFPIQNFQHLGSGDFDWAMVAGLSSLGPDAVQAQTGNAMGSGSGNGNDMYAPAGNGNENDMYAPAGNGNDMYAPAGNGNGNDMYAPATAGAAQNVFDPSYSGPAYPLGARYPAQCGARFGFWQ